MNKESQLKYILYVRKSSESEDRQVLSIESQINELKKLAKNNGVKIVDIIRESKSAKAPGRAGFNTMLAKISKGEAEGILCWKLDRLARNPVDGGQISWMLQQNIIHHILTFERSYFPTDNVLMMSVEFGQANQFIKDLSMNVKRGFRDKRRAGWFTGVAPSGYLNAYDNENAINIIIPDPDRFNLVRKMWDLMLTGNYTVMQILNIANNEWGYRTVKRSKTGGRPLGRSTLYSIFTKTFYYGAYESPEGSGEWVDPASHKPMITKAEYDRVQVLLGSKGKPRPHTREFAFTGLLNCGGCGCQITAEEKNQIICSECKFKFGYENKNSCPKCGIQIEKMINPTILNKVYYHGTKRINPNCEDCKKGIEIVELEKQIEDYLETIQINQKYLDWGIRHLKKMHENETVSRETVYRNQEQAYSEITKKLDKLMDLRLAGEIDEQEYIAKKQSLLKEKEKYSELLQNTNARQNQWLNTAEDTLTFAHHAKYWFEDAKKNKDLKKQREILNTLGSNLILKDRKLSISAPEPFRLIEKAIIKIPAASEMFEPEFNTVNKRKKTTFNSDHLSWLGRQGSNLRQSD